MPRYLIFLCENDNYYGCMNFWVKMNNFTFRLLEKTYKTTESGISCDATEGAVELSTKLECNEAVPRIQNLVPGATFSGSLSMDERPPGCFYHPGHSLIYWNNLSDGISCSSCKSICYEGSEGSFTVATE